MAKSLARLVATAGDLLETPGLRAGLLAEADELWPVPHSPMFDFAATANGTEWIDEIAARARAGLDDAVGPPAIGHDDWSVKHFRFVDDRISVVYDWDSIVRADEPFVVGQAASSFPATWYLPTRLAPTPGEARAFVADYESARSRRFEPDERLRLAAAGTYALAYRARCEACSDSTATNFPPESVRAILALHGDDFLQL